MDITFAKIQTELLKKLIDSVVTGKWGKVAYQRVDNFVYITLDGREVYVIPHQFFLVDEFASGLNIHSVNFTKLLGDDNGESAVIDTMLSTKYKNGTVRIFQHPTDGEIWIDEKILKTYGIKDSDNITYRSSGATSPLFVLYEGYCIGCILPIKH